MEIKTFKAEYRLVEFYHYIDCTISANPISVIELLVDTSDIEFLKDELTILIDKARNKDDPFNKDTINKYHEIYKDIKKNSKTKKA